MRAILGSGSNKRRFNGGRKRLEKRSATKIKIWFWDILDRQANFGRGSRDFGAGRGRKAAPRKKKKYAPALKKNIAQQHNGPSRIF